MVAVAQRQSASLWRKMLWVRNPSATPTKQGTFSKVQIRPPLVNKPKVVSILESDPFFVKVRNKYETGDEMATKTCTKCGITKDENEFGWERFGHRNAACKRCRPDTQAGYYESNKAKELEYKATTNFQHALAIKVRQTEQGARFVVFRVYADCHFVFLP
jgi:hypothetical protein